VLRLVAQLEAIGVSISKRQLMRLLISGQDEFIAKRVTCCARLAGDGRLDHGG
jgi:hypothetical protein